MDKHVSASAPLLFAALVVVMGFVAIGAQGRAVTRANQPVDDAVVAYPAHIHSGSCDTLGDVVFPLKDVSRIRARQSSVASPSVDPVSPPEASPVAASPVASPEAGAGDVVAESTTEVAAPLDDILGAEHAINVHESAAEIQNSIACGDLTGPPTDGEVSIEIQELNDSGFTGEAHLADNGDGTTTVTVYLIISGTEGEETCVRQGERNADGME